MALTIFFALLLAIMVIIWLRQQPAGWRGRRVLLWVGIILLLLTLLATYRAALVALLPALLLPLLRDWLRRRPPTVAGTSNNATNTGPNRPRDRSADHSTVDSQWLRMVLNHDSGELYGEVTAGPLTGKRLDELNPQQLNQLWQSCRNDPQSAALLENYLDRVLPDWRERFAAAHQADSEAPNNRSADGPLSRDEAHAILGLQAGASREDIVRAHRRLMQRLHPDHGGSDYLAARINAAKARLLPET